MVNSRDLQHFIMPTTTRAVTARKTDAERLHYLDVLDTDIMESILCLAEAHAVLSARVTCLALHSAIGPRVWRVLSQRLIASFRLRASLTLSAAPVYPRLNIHESAGWYGRLRQAASIRFLMDDERDPVQDHISFPGCGQALVGGTEDYLVLSDDGLTALSDRAMTEPLDCQAELPILPGLGAITLTFNFSGNGPAAEDDAEEFDPYVHLLYLRRGGDGEAIAWTVSDGVCTLHLDGCDGGCACKVTGRPHPDYFDDHGIGDASSETPVQLIGEYGQHRSVVAFSDPEYSPNGKIPGGFGTLFVGVSLYTEEARATLSRIQLH